MVYLTTCLFMLGETVRKLAQYARQPCSYRLFDRHKEQAGSTFWPMDKISEIFELIEGRANNRPPLYSRWDWKAPVHPYLHIESASSFKCCANGICQTSNSTKDLPELPKLPTKHAGEVTSELCLPRKQGRREVSLPKRAGGPHLEIVGILLLLQSLEIQHAHFCQSNLGMSLYLHAKKTPSMERSIKRMVT